jgi:low temperature requirement protein LtrA
MRAMTAPPDQGATFVELFFDLVFVYAITQLTATLRADLTPRGLVETVVVFWLVWWAWTQFTWALNLADTEESHVRLATLLATAVAFFMAQAVPDAFANGGPWFAVPYVGVRLTGLTVYAWVAQGDAEQRASVRGFWLVSLTGMAAVIAGAFAGATLRTTLWVLAIALDLVAATQAGRGTWRIAPRHFAERHALFVIVGLGESLIAAGIGTSEVARTGDLVAAAVLAVLVTCALWWSYFGWAKETAEEGFSSAPVDERARIARDAYSFRHFPIVGGIIGVAVVVEEAVAHPGEPLSTPMAISLAVGVVLFIVGTAFVVSYTSRIQPWLRVGAAAVIAGAIPLTARLDATVALAVVACAVGALAAAEHLWPSATRPGSAPARTDLDSSAPVERSDCEFDRGIRGETNERSSRSRPPS